MSSFTNTDNTDSGFTGFWTIEKFSRCKPNKNLKLRSQTFEIIGRKKTELYVKLEQAKPGYLGIYLCTYKVYTSINIIFSASIRSIFGWVPIFKNIKCDFKALSPGLGIDESIEWQKLEEQSNLYLPNDSLTISFHVLLANSTIQKSSQCSMISRMINKKSVGHLSMQEFCVEKPTNIEIFPASSTTQSHSMEKIKSKSTQTDINKENVIEDLEDLHRFFREKKFCYVTLRSSNKEFAVHKALLCARSPVFSAMFDKDMKENGSNVVDIQDVDCDTLSLLLQFIHFEPLSSLKWDAAVKLYYAADKYQIEPLKNECVSFLKKGLSEGNIGEALILADMHHDEVLKSSALEYFCNNSKTILRSTGWKEMLLSRPELALEILCELAE